jgi:hypothetical protein
VQPERRDEAIRAGDEGRPSLGRGAGSAPDQLGLTEPGR